MANAEQLALLKAGVEGWNKWREQEPDEKVDLTRADLRGADLIQANLGLANLIQADLRGADLSGASFIGADLLQIDLSSANLREAILLRADLSDARLTQADLRGAYPVQANLVRANLVRANLSGAALSRADLREARLIQANLSRADLIEADLSKADLSGADLRDTNLRYSNLVGANISNAIISKSNVYGVNVWDLEGEFKEQKDLVITPENSPIVTVDDIEVAQFIYLILHNEKIRDVINTLTSKSVLILGRFAIPERKAILDSLKDKLREYSLLPIVFDFDRPTDKDFTETIKTLAGLCYFVIADVTNAKSSPLELQATVPDYQIPFVPIIQEGEQPFAMMANLQTKYNWVLDTISYDSTETLMKVVGPAIIDRAIQKHNELRLIKAQQPKILSASDFIDDQGLDNPVTTPG